MMIVDTLLTPFSTAAEITEVLRSLRDIRRNASNADNKGIIDDAITEAKLLLDLLNAREEL